MMLEVHLVRGANAATFQCNATTHFTDKYIMSYVVGMPVCVINNMHNGCSASSITIVYDPRLSEFAREEPDLQPSLLLPNFTN